MAEEKCRGPEEPGDDEPGPTSPATRFSGHRRSRSTRPISAGSTGPRRPHATTRGRASDRDQLLKAFSIVERSGDDALPERRFHYHHEPAGATAARDSAALAGPGCSSPSQHRAVEQQCTEAGLGLSRAPLSPVRDRPPRPPGRVAYMSRSGVLASSQYSTPITSSAKYVEPIGAVAPRDAASRAL